MILDLFHPAVADWFRQTFPAPTDCQRQAWAAIAEGHHALIAAPTGSGKTLAAFLSAIDDLARRAAGGELREATYVLYISPLKALSNDIHKNLEQPLDGVNRRLFERGHGEVALRSMVRTGDTPAVARAAMLKHPPHILVTTPESAYLLLTSESGRRMLKTVQTVIVDEIHAILGSKRGAHLALSLERLERLVERPLNRIGLSATQKPIEEVARFLTGGMDCRIVDTGHLRRLDLAIELPDAPLEAVLSQDAAKSIYDRMAALIEAHRTTLIFVNTRRMAERLARALSERLGEEHITSHHGSLAREQRLDAESRLKSGKLKALVATASLELGIDVGEVDLVCQFGTTRAIATFLQRVGRSGHFAGGVPKGRLFPTSRDELIECLALLDAIRRGELDLLHIPPHPLDVLAQQIVAMVACEDWDEDELYAWVRRAWPYRDLGRKDFEDTVQMLAEGYHTRRGIRSAYLHRDGINRKLRARRGARMTALTCGGAIPDNAEYRVILEPAGEFIGTVDEDFAIESMAGDVFQLGNTSWRLLKLDAGVLRVEDAQGQPPSIPFWLGEAPGRTHELSLALSRLRVEIAERCVGRDERSVSQQADTQTLGSSSQLSLDSVADWLARTLNVSAEAAGQAVNYLAAAYATLGAMPSFDTVVFERFFDESGGMQFIIHAPFGSRLNRAWGLALRKRFCRGFNFELQAAATENAVILSLTGIHSFPLEEVARYLNAKTVRDLLIQALLDAPMFTVRWRWNAVCALALKRFQGGRKTPPYLLRMQAEDLVATVFPDQLACFENIVGDRQIPDHPLVQQTLTDCLSEAMDIDRLIEVIEGLESGSIRVVARDLVEPSPLAAEIVNSRVYSFLDGAPLEERRTRAVASRRWLDPAQAGDLGRLDPAALDRVRAEAWPEVRDAEELHDALRATGFLVAPRETGPWSGYFQKLVEQGRAAVLPLSNGMATSVSLWLAAERWPQFRVLYPGRTSQPALHLPKTLDDQIWEPEAALVDILRGRLAVLGPVQAAWLAADLALPASAIDVALLRLESEGGILRGQFTPGGSEQEWCERGLLARIHRYTLQRLREEIEPVSGAEFMRFLFRWQRLSPDARAEGPDALAAVLDQLEGYEAAAVAWESEILPARLAGYDPAWLDALCLSGKYVWTRLSPASSAQAPVKSSPIALLPRRRLAIWRSPATGGEAELSTAASRVREVLASLGASFFEELAEQSGLLKTQVETALAELAAKGLANADSYKGLRALLVPEDKKRRYRGINPFGIEDAGRWSLMSSPVIADEAERNVRLEHMAGVLLRRYGVVFRALLTRESAAPPWMELVRVYRRMEARGEIRGGRFVAGQFGEQYAQPEAVAALRAVRKQDAADDYCALSAVDPLNLVGIVTPGPKLPAQPGNRLLYRSGVPLALLTGKETRFLNKPEDIDEWDVKNRLVRRTVPPQLKAYL
ncbi:DEAD/DEAH box helicase [Methylococcus sp. EFPC2]|uniref:DEAD/DEAH box helicase n=1 Tax=Methylococcus sp. EFPC2 TaxID=2812648 RepID=UPI0019688A14|nr:DEAD/DEAH box helicase [Methylococcus sp. EFPC2]QSA95678.1 DEAD/DEAH box helicase [Methylococcus sp. EFPC2]